MSTVQITTDARGVATLTLARAEKHNALSAQMMDDITQAARDLGADDAVRVVVLAATGASFCAGGDLNWMRDQIDAAPDQRVAEARRLARMLQTLNTLPKPLIGRVQGNAFGGGVGLCCVCDVVVGAQGAKFGLTETRLGLSPATIGPYVIARMGEARARQVFMSSRVFGENEAVRLGILSYVASPDNLDACVEDEVVPYLACAPGAVADAKRLARSLGLVIDETVIAATIDALAERWKGDEAVEGVGAFFDKRKPKWAK